jgi:tetratricopeptide (TPR) repeat protein
MGMMIRGCVLTCALAALLSASARAAEPDYKKELTRLNDITGTETRAGALREILDNKDNAKKLIQYALPLAKQDKPEALDYNAAILLGLTAAELKDMKSAEVFFRVCMKQAAKLQSVRMLLESYGGLIELYYSQKKFDDAARVCKELLDLKTDATAPHIVYRAYTTRNGEIDFLEDDNFDSARRLRPTVQQMLIKALAKQGKTEQALQLVDGLIKQQDHWIERQLKGWVLREAGKLGDAASVYEDVIKRVSKDTELERKERDDYEAQYRYELSNLYVDLDKVDKASEQLEYLIKRYPQKAGFYNDLGYIWADHDIKLDEAEKMVRKALELDREERKSSEGYDPKTDRDNGAYLDSLAWVYYKQKKFQKAKELLDKAVEDKNSQHIEIYDHLGDVNLALGNRAAAVAAWRKGLEHVGEGRREQERKSAVERKLEQNQ